MVIIRYIIIGTVIILCSCHYLSAQDKLPKEIAINSFKQVSICQGDSVTLHAPFSEASWYSSTACQTRLHVGQAFNVRPVSSTVYYVCGFLNEWRVLDSVVVIVNSCTRRQPIDEGESCVEVIPGAVKLEWSFNKSSGEFLLHGKENWEGCRLRVFDARSRLLHTEILQRRTFRLEGRYTDGVYLISVTVPKGKVYIGKLHLHD